MKRPPSPPNENIGARGLGTDILWNGLLMGIISLGVGYWAYQNGIEAWATMVFTTLTLTQMGNALAFRSERDSIFRIGFRTNMSLLGAVLLTFALQLAIIYIPIFQNLFSTEPLTLGELAISLAASTILFWAIEIEKFWRRRRSRI